MSENTIQKPVDIVIDETKQQVIDVINQSRLPLSIVEFLLKDTLAMVSSEVARAKQEYYREMAKQAQTQPQPSSDVPAPGAEVPVPAPEVAP